MKPRGKLVAAPLPSTVPPAPWTNFFNLVRTDENNGNTGPPPDFDVPLDSTIINNVDALNFVYLDEDGEDLDPDTTPDDPADGRKTLSILDPATEADILRIRSVQVAMVVRTTNEDLRYTNNETYRNLQDSDDDGDNDIIYIAPGDNFRRRVITKQIKIRNAGL